MENPELTEAQFIQAYRHEFEAVRDRRSDILLLLSEAGRGETLKEIVAATMRPEFQYGYEGQSPENVDDLFRKYPGLYKSSVEDKEIGTLPGMKIDPDNLDWNKDLYRMGASLRALYLLTIPENSKLRNSEIDFGCFVRMSLSELIRPVYFNQGI